MLTRTLKKNWWGESSVAGKLKYFSLLQTFKHTIHSSPPKLMVYKPKQIFYFMLAPLDKAVISTKYNLIFKISQIFLNKIYVLSTRTELELD